MVTRATAFVSLLVSLTAWLYVVHRVSHRGVLYRLVQPSKRDRDCDSDQTECTCPPCMYIYTLLSTRVLARLSCLCLPVCLITWKRITLRFAAVISRDIHLLCNTRGNLPNRSFLFSQQMFNLFGRLYFSYACHLTDRATNLFVHFFFFYNYDDQKLTH